jgi:hypothetical protein
MEAPPRGREDTIADAEEEEDETSGRAERIRGGDEGKDNLPYRDKRWESRRELSKGGSENASTTSAETSSDDRSGRTFLMFYLTRCKRSGGRLRDARSR